MSVLFLDSLYFLALLNIESVSVSVFLNITISVSVNRPTSTIDSSMKRLLMRIVIGSADKMKFQLLHDTELK